MGPVFLRYPAYSILRTVKNYKRFKLTFYGKCNWYLKKQFFQYILCPYNSKIDAWLQMLDN